jgi:hypothetical protein
MEWKRALATDQMAVSRNQAADVAYAGVSAGLRGGIGCCDMGGVMTPKLFPGGNCFATASHLRAGACSPKLAGLGARFYSQFRRVVRRKPCAAFCDFDAQGTYFEVMM